MKWTFTERFAQLLIAIGLLAAPGAQATVIGPLGGTGLSGEYASFADSPFSGLNFSGGYFHLEDFEDGFLNTPGVSASVGGVTSVVFGPGAHDSVDTDDGVLDGNGLAGDSYFSASGANGILFSFDALILGALPTHAGLVWTDGSSSIRFIAYDETGAVLGTSSGTHANGSFLGETDDDRFYGAINAGGISALFISNGGGGIEIDHLQYGALSRTPPVPVPASLPLLAAALSGFWMLRRRRALS